MNRFWGFGVLSATLFGALAACSGGSDGGNAGASGSGNSAGASGSSDGCVNAPDALFTPQQFGESDLIRQIQIDKDTLYFRTLDTLYKVPVAGGAPEVVAALPTQEPDEFWVQADSLIVRSGALLLSVPKEGRHCHAARYAAAPRADELRRHLPRHC